jgi:hypothetical protein
MSYYFGVICRGLVIMVSDRISVEYPDEKVSAGKRFFIPRPNLGICFCGNLPFGQKAAQILTMTGINLDLEPAVGEPPPFHIENLVSQQSAISEILSDVYRDWREKAAGKAWEGFERVDLLLGGTSLHPPFAPFLGCLSSSDDFKLQIDHRHGIFIRHNSTQEVLDLVGGGLRVFMEKASNGSSQAKRDLAKRLFPKVLYLARRGEDVSDEGDLVFIENAETEIFEFDSKEILWNIKHS